MKKLDIALSAAVLLTTVIVTCCTVITSANDYETNEDVDVCVNDENNTGSKECQVCRCMECLHEFVDCDAKCWRIIRCTVEQGCLQTDDPTVCVNSQCKNLVVGSARNAVVAGTLLNCLGRCEDVCEPIK